MQNPLTRELALKRHAQQILSLSLVKTLDASLLPLKKITFIVDYVQTPKLIQVVKEFLDTELTIFSDTEEGENWCDFQDKSYKIVIADLQSESRLYPFQYLNLLNLAKSEHLIIVTNELLFQYLAPLFPSAEIIDLPYFPTFSEENFTEIGDSHFDLKISRVLQTIYKEKENILVYCDNLHQMDQIYQALYFHTELSQQKMQIHLILPSEPFYAKYTNELMSIAYPETQGERQIYITMHYIDLVRHLKEQPEQPNIQIIIHMGYARIIKKYYPDIQSVIYRQTALSKTDILLRNRVSYFPRVDYYYSVQDFIALNSGELIDDEEFEFNQECLSTRAKILNIPLKIQSNEVDEEFYKSHIPFSYHEYLLDAENETFNYYSQMVSTLLTQGEILSSGNLESKKNPFMSLSIKQEREALIRSNHYWSKMGDITSWIQLINKFIIFIEEISQKDEQPQTKDIEQRKSQNDLIKWCRIQNINMPKLILILAYNEYILELTQKYQSEYSILNKMGSLDALKLNRTVSLKKQQSMPEHSEDIQAYILRLFYRGLCVFSGHKSAGYHNFQTSITFKLCHNNLMAIIGDFPLTCIVMALNQTQSGGLEIKYSTKIDDIIIPQIAPKEFVKLHKLNFIKRQSLHLSEITFNNISQVLFNQLWKSQNGPTVSQECIIQPNMDLNLIQVLYNQETVNGEQLKKEIQSQIDKLKNGFQKQMKEIPYENHSKFIMEAGARIKDWIDRSAYKTFFIQGLPLDITQEALIDFLDEVRIDEIKLQKEGDLITARVTLQDRDDIEWCLENIEQYNENTLKVYHQHDQYEYIEQKLNFKESFLIEISWQIHLNKQFTIINLKNGYEPNAIEIGGTFYNITRLDGNRIKILNLDPYLREEDIYKAFEKEEILSIELEQKFRYENNGDLLLEIRKLLYDFKKIVNKQDEFYYEIESIEKHQSKRVLRLIISQKEHVDLFLKLNNQIKHFRGLPVKLHIKQEFIHEYDGPIEMKQVIQDIFEEKQALGQYTMDVDVQNGKIHVKVLTLTLENHDALNKEISSAFQYRKIEDIKDVDLSCLYSQTGIRFLKFLQEELQILIKQDFINNQILINASDSKYQEAIKKITHFAKDSVKTIVNIPKQAIKMIMGIDSQGLNDIKNKFELKSVKFNSASGELTLCGDQKNIDYAQISISDMISQQQLNKDVNQIVCNYCFDSMKNGYMLQGCGHKFCLQCIMFSVQNSLGDMNQLPIKCPQCNQQLLLADLYILLDEESWEKLIKLAINKYVQDNAVDLSFCITPNCPMIYFNKIPRYTCDKCNNIYCNTCKAAYHYGQTCRECKAGSVDSINIYMKKYDVRRCPNCKVLIQRIDGCYRVTCTGCKKSICWKNNKEGAPCMEIYETASECYAHLTKEHGGYW